ncbi:cation:proton antiporter [Sorangium sp. So ce128]|uniref:cation:proton antiporter n=1 Tax=Sorangium sp. So ce128 TaxID=3133281 RepID=UPI003F5F3D9B
MRERLESLLLVLAVGSAVAIGAKRVAIPYNVALVLVGLLLVVVDVLPKAPMDPEVILIAFLPVLVFEGALFADADSLRGASRPILALAVPGVLISLLGTAAVATQLLALPFAAALLLGALLSITDTVSVLLAFRSVRVPHRLAAIMEGESLFNDGTALVLVVLASQVLASGSFDGAESFRALALAMAGGAAVGGALGAVGASLLRRTPDHLTAILASIVLVFATALLAERLHASPVIAVVVLGVIVGKAARRILEPSRVLALQGFWETSGFCLNVLLFELVGMQIQAEMLVREAASIGLALIALHAGRAVAVYGCFGVLRALTGEVVPFRWQHVMLVGNIKGALSMAAVLSLPSGLPYRDRLITIVFGVTFVTLVAQALPFARLLKFLRVAIPTADAALDAAKATLIAARRGQSELDDLLAAGLVSRKEHAERRAAFQRQVIRAEVALQTPQGEAVRDHLTDLALLSAQKAAVLDAARRGLIAADTAHAHVNQIDRAMVELPGGHAAPGANPHEHEGES